NILVNGVSQGSRTTFSNLPAGSYELEISSSDGCQTTLIVNLTAPNQLDVQLTTNIDREKNIVNAGDSVQLTALINIPMDQVADINWITSEGNLPGHSLTHTFNPSNTSSYGVEITDVNGCKASDRLAIVVQKTV